MTTLSYCPLAIHTMCRSKLFSNPLNNHSCSKYQPQEKTKVVKYLRLQTALRMRISGRERIIRESVDSLRRDDADMPRPPYIRKAYNRPNAAFVSLFR